MKKETISIVLDTCLEVNYSNTSNDFAKLVILYAYMTFFSTTTTYEMTLAFLEYVEYYDQLNKVSKDIHKYLTKHLNKQRDIPRSQLCGCIMILLVRYITILCFFSIIFKFLQMSFYNEIIYIYIKSLY